MKNSINREFRSLSEFKKYFYPEPIESLILDPEELGAKLAKEVLAHSDKIMQNLGIPKHLLEGSTTLSIQNRRLLFSAYLKCTPMVLVKGLLRASLMRRGSLAQGGGKEVRALGPLLQSEPS